jgi:allantoicase
MAARFGEKNRSIAPVPQIFKVGAYVYHPQFGNGKVIRREGDRHAEKVLIRFGAGKKKLHLETALSGGLRVTRR